MRLLAAAIALSLATVAQPRGAVTSVTAEADPGNPGVFLFTVQGTRPCGAVNLDTGDGSSITHAVLIPTTISYEYKRTGTFTVRASGQGNCDGLATTTVRVTTVRPQPPPPPPPATPTPTPPPSRGGGAPPQPTQPPTQGQRGGSSQPPQNPPAQSDSRARRGGSGGGFDWTDQGFRQLDLNRDDRISRMEWRYDIEDFVRLDRNRDNVLTFSEFELGSLDDGRVDRFEDLDLNRDNRIDRREWRGSIDAFRGLDRNNDGYLSRFEAAGGETPDRRNPGTSGRLYPPANARSITLDVSARQNWTDTGITVRAGEPMFIRANGRIQFSNNPGDIAEPDGARGRAATPRAPLPDVFIGALVGRVGNSEPFVIGIDSEGLRAPRDGRLYLGVNDDILRDNSGAFRVVLTIAR